MTSKVAFVIGVLILFANAGAAASDARPEAKRPPSWRVFWSSVGVTPAPPRNFLEIKYTGRVHNFTHGALSNETARRWVVADIRRGKGDLYAGYQLREDIANADLFGPPGLNGTGDAIRSLRAQGVDHLEGPAMADVIAAAVIAVPKKTQREFPDAGFTDYVIVLMYRAAPAPIEMVFRDGRRQEAKETKSENGLYWQLDTGHFQEHPVLGPLWYQKNGWSCRPDDSVAGKLCGLVKP